LYFPPANEEERKNDTRVKQEADFVLNWKSEKDETKKIISASHLLEWVKKLYV
jgi:hypothetical protein